MLPLDEVCGVHPQEVKGWHVEGRDVERKLRYRVTDVNFLDTVCVNGDLKCLQRKILTSILLQRVVRLRRFLLKEFCFIVFGREVGLRL